MQEAISVENKKGVPALLKEAIERHMKEEQPTMGIVKEADKADKNKQVQVEKTFEMVGKKMANENTKPSEVGGIAVDRLRAGEALKVAGKLAANDNEEPSLIA